MVRPPFNLASLACPPAWSVFTRSEENVTSQKRQISKGTDTFLHVLRQTDRRTDGRTKAKEKKRREGKLVGRSSKQNVQSLFDTFSTREPFSFLSFHCQVGFESMHACVFVCVLARCLDRRRTKPFLLIGPKSKSAHSSAIATLSIRTIPFSTLAQLSLA